MKNVLLIEDNEGDQRLFAEALRYHDIEINVNVVHDGIQAVAFLKQQSPYQGSQRPDIILLDLNLPKKSGQEVLSEIKNDENLKRIPVIILTTSAADKDIQTCYDLHANCYLIKPSTFTALLDLVSKIKDFWFSAVRLSAN